MPITLSKCISKICIVLFFLVFISLNGQELITNNTLHTGFNGHMSSTTTEIYTHVCTICYKI